MHEQDLGGDWQLRDADGEHELDGRVPGCVHLDLQAADRLPEFWWRDAEREIHWVAARDWHYRRDFALDAELAEADELELRCEGLDTLATLRINEQELLHADNMFRCWRIDPRHALRDGTNRIDIHFASPLPAMRAGEHRQHMAAWNIFDERYQGASWIRKMPCSFGWDWGPMAPSCGIWRRIALRGWTRARLSDVHPRQRHHVDGSVDLRVAASARHLGGYHGKLHLRAVLERDGTVVAEAEQQLAGEAQDLLLHVAEPELWWPNGLGAQPLYDLRVELRDDDGELRDHWQRRIGLRRIELLREDDEWGQSFAFAVNGLRFFAQGANWIPADSFPARVSEAHYRHLLESARDAHMNMIRCWGGGIYEQDVFYELCDELGLLVWQDFMFACATYPSFEAGFLDSVREEAIDNVRRLRHHPCLALWCGNNELEQGLVGDEWTAHQMSWSDYAALFDELLPAVVAEHDPDTSYWPSSGHTPPAVGDRRKANDPRYGDAHCWDVWHGGKPIEHQRTWLHRFMSEFGFQSYPELRTVAGFTAPEDRNLTSYVMDFHQRSVGRGNKTIFAYLLDWFRVPKDFEQQLWCSQLLQGLCVQQAVEHTRRRQERMEGILYWQLNDIWPAPTWSSIDVHGRWKALQHIVRRAFAPLMVAGFEDHSTGSVAVFASNVGSDEADVELHWQISDCAGVVLAEGDERAELPPQRSTELLTIDCQPFLQEPGERELLVWLELRGQGGTLARNLATLARPKHLELRPAAIAVDWRELDEHGGTVVLRSEHPALWCRLELVDADAWWSDNWFHLAPGEERAIDVRPWQALPPNDIRDRLRVSSLVDTY